MALTDNMNNSGQEQVQASMAAEASIVRTRESRKLIPVREVPHRKCDGKGSNSCEAGGPVSLEIRKCSKRRKGNPSRNRSFDPPLQWSRKREADRSNQQNHGCTTIMRRISIPQKHWVQSSAPSPVAIPTSPNRWTPEKGHNENGSTIGKSSTGTTASDETHERRDLSPLPEPNLGIRFSSDTGTNSVTIQGNPDRSSTSIMDKRRMRAEKNRASAKKSRLEAKIREKNLKDDARRIYKKNRKAKEKLNKIRAGIRKCLDRAEKYLSKSGAMAKIPQLYQRLRVIDDVIRRCSMANENAFDVSVLLSQ